MNILLSHSNPPTNQAMATTIITKPQVTSPLMRTIGSRRLSFLRSRLDGGRRFFTGAGARYNGRSVMAVAAGASGSFQSGSFASLGVSATETSAASYSISGFGTARLDEQPGQRT